MLYINALKASFLDFKNEKLYCDNMSLLFKAWLFATERHAKQTRKNAAKSPYITHPVEVTQILIDAGVTDEETLAAALLHDTIEDTGVTHTQLTDLFGRRVADFVQECTDNKSLSKVDRKKLQIEHAAVISDNAKVIKLADKISNLKGMLGDPPVNWTPDVRHGYIVWCRAVTTELRGVSPKLDLMAQELYDRLLFDQSTETLQADLKSYYKLLW